MNEPTLQPYVSVTPVEDGMVVLDERNGRYWQVNGTGALVLQALCEGTPRAEMADLLIRRHPEVADRADDDVEAFLRMLGDAHLVRRAPR